MHPERFQQLCLDTLGTAPITSIESWQEPGMRPYGLVIGFSSGSRLWVGITSVSAPGATSGQTDTPIPAGTPATERPLPKLYQDGKVTPDRAEKYLTAALTKLHHAEIARVYGYSDRPSPATHPGVGIELHSGARIHLAFAHTARPGRDRGRRPYDLQAMF